MEHFPEENDLIDVHTHSGISEPGTFRIMNVFTHDFHELPENSPVSIGLHPWYISNKSEKEFEGNLRRTMHFPMVKAIGETGLDRLCGISMDKQEKIFRMHIILAIEAGKPLIIHCVRAYEELIKLKDHYPSDIAWVVHGFNTRPHIAKELATRGFYLSISKRLLKDKNKSLEFSKIVPLRQIFAETDDEQISLFDIYRGIAHLYKVEISLLRKMIRENYMDVFKSENHDTRMAKQN